MKNSMDTDELRHIVALTLIDDVGPVAVRRLAAYFGSCRAVFSASSSEISRVSRIQPEAAARIGMFSCWKRVDEELERARKLGVDLVTPDDDRYPELLRNIYDYPSLLYVKGDLSGNEICLAVVGSRRATAQGLHTGDRLSRELALRGVTVVSGMARGIDSSAHRGALSVRGRTIAVLGSGLDVIYPPENTKLFESIVAQGAVVSEYPFGSSPLAHHFPRRNRIISGMSYGVVVIEAAAKSGSLITARMALEQGREVFAVPGSIESGMSRGTNTLIQEGAKLVQGVDDILDEVRSQVRQERHDPGETSVDAVPSGPDPVDGIPHVDRTDDESGKEQKAILRFIGGSPVHFDDLAEQSGIAVDRLLDRLLTLELNGLIKQLPGCYYINQE
ncbi:MAG: DNA-processing protein DprA [Syntrophales bacterium]|jgi:DNA processing protein|nr:DNA-processing protein DprA [Syntrophales bacterium]MCK9527601.1 DNA-processing protein DprA [Syntrophales bacterium]MDX9922218.1 DNA-processing protein DprA [Syntrophales bacterium]